ncbi:Serine/threonine-protein kinase [Lachnellula occidentalis]|uniref:EKC/KEOPS complex subunit BUD32 n=1 Tax=Lachnellula occidentalis TaxID=215460 RepID=A0A8H8RWZ8_9HELO|nr:Serine/threonine-protein kinase [Lachnellula occidentalis]
MPLSPAQNSPVYADPDQDLDIHLNDDDDDDAPLYERGWLCNAEDREEYRPGGFHPVLIGDRFGEGGRFRVLHKLGRGGLATVWLCADQEREQEQEQDSQKYKYVALKIVIAEESRGDSPELRFANNQEGLDFGEAGGEGIAIPSEHFWHEGPNGRHLCLVLPVLGPRVSALWNRSEDPARVARDVALQVTRGLYFLHKNGICHGDFRPSNILFRLPGHGFDDLSEHALMTLLGPPRTEPLVPVSGQSPAPSGPDYIVESLNLEHLPARFISTRISIIDFGESYDPRTPPPDLGITASFRPPELLFDNTIGVGCDLWALACTVFEIRTGCHLFENFMDDDDEVIMQMVPLLGKLPEPWWGSWKERGRWFADDECGTAWVDPKTGRPYILTDTLEELLAAPMGKDPKVAVFAVRGEENKSLGNLLRGLLRYEPGNRMSVGAVLEHAWFRDW